MLLSLSSEEEVGEDGGIRITQEMSSKQEWPFPCRSRGSLRDLACPVSESEDLSPPPLPFPNLPNVHVVLMQPAQT